MILGSFQKKIRNPSCIFLSSQVGLDMWFTNASAPGVKMLTVCIAFSCYQITFHTDEHNSLESVPPVSGSLPLHHKILQFGHYGCLFLVYFCAGYLGTSISLWFLLPNLAPTSPVKILRVRGRFFFTLSSLWHNLQFSSSLIQKEMQYKPVTKLFHLWRSPISQEERGLTCTKLD